MNAQDISVARPSLLTMLGDIPMPGKFYKVLESNKITDFCHKEYGKGGTVVTVCKCGKHMPERVSLYTDLCSDCNAPLAVVSRLTTHAYLKEVDNKISFGLYTINNVENKALSTGKTFLENCGSRLVVCFNYKTSKLYAISRRGKSNKASIKTLVSFASLEKLLGGEYGSEFYELCMQRANLFNSHVKYLANDKRKIVALYRKPHYEVYLSSFYQPDTFSDGIFFEVPEAGTYPNRAYNALIASNSGKEAKKVFDKFYNVKMSSHNVELMVSNCIKFNNLCYYSSLFGYDRAQALLDKNKSLRDLDYSYSLATIPEVRNFIKHYGINRAYKAVLGEIGVSAFIRDTARQWAFLIDDNKNYIHRDGSIMEVHDAISRDYNVLVHVKHANKKAYDADTEALMIEKYSRTVDGIEFNPLIIGNDFSTTGGSWGNCVAGYLGLVQENGTVIVSSYKDGKPWLCIEIDTKSGSVVQVELPKRVPLGVREEGAVIRYMDACGHSISRGSFDLVSPHAHLVDDEVAVGVPNVNFGAPAPAPVGVELFNDADVMDDRSEWDDIPF